MILDKLADGENVLHSPGDLDPLVVMLWTGTTIYQHRVRRHTYQQLTASSIPLDQRNQMSPGSDSLPA